MHNLSKYDLVKIHDDALDLENDILDFTELLSNQRIEFGVKWNPKELEYIIPTLNSLIDGAEKYKEFIEDTLNQINS